MSGYNQYGGNYNYEPTSWKDILKVLVVMFGLPSLAFLVYQAYKIYKYFVGLYGVDTVWGTIIGGSIALSILGTIAFAMVEGLLNWWDRVWLGTGYDPKAAQTAYNATSPANNINKSNYVAPTPKTSIWGNNKTKTTGLLAGERESPPRAEFFGRFSGQEQNITGAYEEKYLNTFEKTYWEKQKALKPALQADCTHENDPTKLEMVETTTKIDKWA